MMNNMNAKKSAIITVIIVIITGTAIAVQLTLPGINPVLSVVITVGAAAISVAVSLIARKSKSKKK